MHYCFVDGVVGCSQACFKLSIDPFSLTDRRTKDLPLRAAVHSNRCISAMRAVLLSASDVHPHQHCLEMLLAAPTPLSVDAYVPDPAG